MSIYIYMYIQQQLNKITNNDKIYSRYREYVYWQKPLSKVEGRIKHQNVKIYRLKHCIKPIA